MKTITLFLVLFSMNVFAQADSSKQRVSGVILKGRESDIVCLILKRTNDLPVLDSIVKVIYVNKPANNANVTFNGVPNKEWMRVLRRVRSDAALVDNNAFKNIHDQLVLLGGEYINHQIVLDDLAAADAFDDMKKKGQNYAQKDDN